MMIWIRSFGMLIAVVLLCGADMPRERPLNWAQPVIQSKICNLYKVSADVYRAERPVKSDITDLKILNIKSLLNLREYHADDESFSVNGFQLIHYKMKAGDISEIDLIAVLKLLDAAKKPVLIHCWHGSDRTGLVIAAYRMVFQNWNRKDAIDEFLLGGFGYNSRVYPNILHLLETMNIDAVKEAVLN
jgi:protein tyrosine/serine phosphatase